MFKTVLLKPVLLKLKYRYFHKWFKFALCLSMWVIPVPVLSIEIEAGKVSKGQEPDTGFLFWQWEADGFSLRLSQLLPDQTRAFFQARGFEPQVADEISRSCVLWTILRNTEETNDVNIKFDLTEWRVITANQSQPMLVREHWAGKWLQQSVSDAARIALEWSLLQTQDEYATGDYNWGMSSYGLPPGSRFDLQFTWYRDDERFTGILKDIECSADIEVKPKVEL